jgi:hypothetical protein
LAKPKQHGHDLLIGENEWILFVQHDWAKEEWFYIDDLLQHLEPLFDYLEIHCVAGCCGLDAFSFTRDDIWAIVPKIDSEAMVIALESAIETLKVLPHDVLGSKRLNNGIDRNTMLNLLRHICDTIAHAEPRQDVRKMG